MPDSRDQPELGTLSYKPPKCVLPNEDGGVLANPEQLNQTWEGNIKGRNSIIITEIESLVSQANEKMYDLPVHPVRSQAIEEIDIFLRITIKKQLREAFE